MDELDKNIFCANCRIPMTSRTAYPEPINENINFSQTEHRVCSKECFFNFKNKLRAEYGLKPLKNQKEPRHNSEIWKVFRCNKCKKVTRNPENKKGKTCVCGNHILISEGEILFSGTRRESQEKMFELGGEAEELS